MCNSFWIGEPIEAYVKDNKFFVKGKLWEKSPEARAFWDKAIEMQESGSTRKPGMSVEGKALERDKKNPKRVTKALITNIALTMTPVNTKTYLDIEKSKGGSVNDLLEIQKSTILFEYCTENGLVQIDNNFKVNFQKSHSFDVDSFWEIYRAVQEGRVEKSVFETVKAGEPDMTMLYSSSENDAPATRLFRGDTLSDNNYLGVLMDQTNSTKLENFFATDWFKLFILYVFYTFL